MTDLLENPEYVDSIDSTSSGAALLAKSAVTIRSVFRLVGWECHGISCKVQKQHHTTCYICSHKKPVGGGTLRLEKMEPGPISGTFFASCIAVWTVLLPNWAFRALV